VRSEIFIDALLSHTLNAWRGEKMWPREERGDEMDAWPGPEREFLSALQRQRRVKCFPTGTDCHAHFNQKFIFGCKDKIKDHLQ